LESWNGHKVLFQEDIWIGQCSLATLYWDLYSVVNEQMCTVADTWDGNALKLFSFIHTICTVMFDRWLDLVELIKTIRFMDEADCSVWPFHSSRVYSVSSFYGIVNNGGVIAVHTPAVWKLHTPLAFIFYYGC
jgi:hypothetical protein